MPKKRKAIAAVSSAETGANQDSRGVASDLTPHCFTAMDLLHGYESDPEDEGDGIPPMNWAGEVPRYQKASFPDPKVWQQQKEERRRLRRK